MSDVQNANANTTATTGETKTAAKNHVTSSPFVPFAIVTAVVAMLLAVLVSQPTPLRQLIVDLATRGSQPSSSRPVRGLRAPVPPLLEEKPNQPTRVTWPEANATEIARIRTLLESQAPLELTDFGPIPLSMLAEDVLPHVASQMHSMIVDEKTPNEPRELLTYMKERKVAVPRKAPPRPLLTPPEIARIKDMSTFAGAAYCNLAADKCGRHCDNPVYKAATLVNDITRAASRVLVFKRPELKEIVVSFRGSDNARNWINDFRWTLVPYPYVPGLAALNESEVHIGFLTTYGRVRTELIKTLYNVLAAESDPSAYNVVVTGHSLGGALAIVSAGDIAESLGLPAARVSIMAYGAPRSGTRDFVEWLVRRVAGIQRVIQDNDVIPHFPPYSSTTYMHTPGERWIVGNETVYRCEIPEDPACSNSRVPFLSASAHVRFFGTELYFGSSGCLVAQ